MLKLSYKLNRTICIDDDWLKKFQTLTLAGNGTALVMLGSFIKSTSTQNSIEILRDNVILFVPFIIGIIISAGATLLAIQVKEEFEHQKSLRQVFDEVRDNDALQEHQKRLAVKSYLIKMNFATPEQKNFNTLVEALVSKNEMDDILDAGNQNTLQSFLDKSDKKIIRLVRNVKMLFIVSAILFGLGLIILGFGDMVYNCLKFILIK